MARKTLGERAGPPDGMFEWISTGCNRGLHILYIYIYIYIYVYINCWHLWDLINWEATI